MNNSNKYVIRIAERDDIDKCYVVMSQLRPHIAREDFTDKVLDLMNSGYKLVFVSDGEHVLAVAGYRISTNLAWGKFLYVDDLVTDEKMRSKGVGQLLLQWLIEEAKRNNCREFHLDSGVQRKDAHRFYRREGMELSCYHFVTNT